MNHQMNKLLNKLTSKFLQNKNPNKKLTKINKKNHQTMSWSHWINKIRQKIITMKNQLGISLIKSLLSSNFHNQPLNLYTITDILKWLIFNQDLYPIFWKVEMFSVPLRQVQVKLWLTSFLVLNSFIDSNLNKRTELES